MNLQRKRDAGLYYSGLLAFHNDSVSRWNNRFTAYRFGYDTCGVMDEDPWVSYLDSCDTCLSKVGLF